MGRRIGTRAAASTVPPAARPESLVARLAL